MKIKNQKLPLAIVIGSYMLAASVDLLADDNNYTLEEIIVTAQKRAQSLQDVPISMQAVDGDAIAKANISRLQDLSDSIPNVTIAKSSQNARIYVRGIGTNSNPGFEQSVALYSDGLYMGRGQQSKFPFIDIERVEVLKGPQGILFGKNATAGALNITTKNPGDEFEGEVRVAAGEYGEYTGNLILSGPLSDTVGARIAAFGRNFGGYLDNTALDRDEEQREEYGVRGTVVFSPSDDLEVNVKYESGVFYTDGLNYQTTYDPQYATALESLMGEGKLDDEKSEANIGLLNAEPVANKTLLDNLIVKLDYALGDSTLTSISSYSQYDWAISVDFDFSALSVANQIRDENFDQLSQEIRLVSPGGETVDYVVGGYYQRNHLDIDSYTVVDATLLGAPLTVGAFDTFAQKSSSLAFFGQADWHLTDDLSLSLGLRWNKEEKTVDNTLITGLYDLTPSATGDFVVSTLGGSAHQLDEDRKESHISPMMKLQWDYSDTAMIYAGVSQGYKGGGFDAGGLNGSSGTSPDDSFEFEEEEVIAYEVGGKMHLQEDTATFNWAVFHSTYENMQVSSYNGSGFVIGNAAKAIVQGVEVEYRWAINENLMVNANAAYLDFEWDQFTDAACTVAQDNAWSGSGDCSQDLTGERGAMTPELTASLGVQYHTPLTSSIEFRSELNLNYSDEYNTETDLDPNVAQDAFTKVNLFMAIASMDDTWELAVIGKNLTDEKISSAGNDNPAIDYAYRRYLELPRQFSVQGTWRF